MQYRHLGSGGPPVSELALGTMVFGEEGPRGASADDSRRIIDAFIDAGGTHIDTANVYAAGRSEEIVGAALQGRRDSVVLATKARFGSDPSEAGLAPPQIRTALDRSLRRLNTDYVDLYYFHAWDPAVPIEESLGTVGELVRAGKVRSFGVSNFKAWQLMKAVAISQSEAGPMAVAGQYQYSLVVRDIEREFIDLCESEGIGIVPWGPLGGGYLSGKYQAGARPSSGRLSTQPDNDEEAWSRRNTDRNWAIVDAVRRVADGGGWTVPQVALAWVLAQPAVASVVIGARTMEQLQDNLGALDVELDDASMNLLDEASALEESYPYRFIDAYVTG